MSKETSETNDRHSPEDGSHDTGESSGDSVAAAEPSPDAGLTSLRDLVDMDATFAQVCETQRERPPEASVPIDMLFELLAEPGNRFVLTYLLVAESGVPLGDLIEYVVSRAETPEGMTDDTFRGKVATRLVHSNLPKLADAGVIEYDDDLQTLRPTSATDYVAPYLALTLPRRENEA